MNLGRRRAVEGGVVFFDTADVYDAGRSEIITGRLLQKLFGTREEYVVATKVHGRTMPGENGAGLSRKHVMASIDAPLERPGLDMIPKCIDQGVGVLPRSPLARCLLAGTRTRGGERRTERAPTDTFGDSLYTEADFAVVDRAAEVAAARGVPAAQVARARLLGKPEVTAPIVGATKIEHLDDARAAEELSLDAGEIAALEEQYVPHAIAGH